MAKKKKQVTDIIIPEKEEIIPKDQTTADQEPMETEVSGSGNIIIEKSNVLIEPFKKRHEKHYKGQPHHLAVDLIIAGVVISMIILTGFIYWGVGANYSAKDLSVQTFVQPEEIKSIDSVTYTIEYQNNNEIDLYETELILGLPNGFIVKDVNPSQYFNQHTHTFNIGDMPASSSGKIIITGDIIASVDDYANFEVNFSYNYKSRLGIDRSDGKKVSKKILVKEKSLEFSEVDFPQNFVNGQATEIILNLSNSSDMDIKNLVVESATPDGFEVLSSDLKIDQLSASTSDQISLVGKITGQEGTDLEKEIKFELFILAGDKKLKQAEISKTVSIIYPKVNLSIAVKDGRTSVYPGATAEYIINYENKGKKEIQNLIISAELIGQFFNLNSIQTDGNASGNKIVWTNTENLRPNEKGFKTFKVKIHPNINLSNSEQKKNFSITAVPGIEYTIEGSESPISLKGQGTEEKVNTLLTFSPIGRYYFAGEQIGRGPLPPKVGQTTTYWIFGKIINTVNEVENVTVTGTLGPNVQWTGQTSVAYGESDLSYNPQTGQVTWKINFIPDSFHSDVDNPNITAGFAVNLTPSADQVGQFATLISNITITARDKWTGADLVYKAYGVTTDLQDEQAAGKGKVSY